MTTTIETLASEISKAFEGAKRNDGTEYRRLRDGSPEWMDELVRDAAHAGGKVFPCDWRYEAVERCVDVLAEGDDDPSPPEPDIYNHELLSWLRDDPAATDYCDQAREEGFVAEDTDMIARISAGQAVLLSEIFYAVQGALEARVREEAEESEDEAEAS